MRYNGARLLNERSVVLTAKQREKIQKRLGVLKLLNAGRGCWVCGSQSGLKASRESVGVRCKQCLGSGKSTAHTTEYEQLKDALQTGRPVDAPGVPV